MKKGILYHLSHGEHEPSPGYHEHHHAHHFEKNTRLVVIISFFAMVLEIAFGYHTGSLALLADGYHMGSHVLALGISWMTYVLARKWQKKNHYRFNRQNLMSLAGFTSSLILLYFCSDIIMDSFERWKNPRNISFAEALGVSVFGFLVNLISIIVLHHKHEEHDINIRSAYIHVLSDILTSILAIVSLLLGFILQWTWTDLIAGFLSAVFILYWSIGLMKKSCVAIIELKKNK